MGKNIKKFNESWNDEDDKQITGPKDQAFVSCDEEYETKSVVTTMQLEFPDSNKKDIEDVFKECCKDVDSPRPRKEFIECMRSKLKLKNS